MISTPLRPVPSAHELEIDLRSAAASLIQQALGNVRDPAAAGHEKAVHETRKRIKELRALLRLVDSALVDQDGRPARTHDNDQLRDAAGGLAGARDADVMMLTLDALPACDDGALAGVDLSPVRKHLARRRKEAAADKAGFARATEILEGVLGRAAAWRIDAADAWDALEPGLKRIYRRGRRAMRQALTTSDPAPWHDWRRRAKDLRYAIEFLREAAPPLLKGGAEAASQLTDHLGDDHDLAVLAVTLSEADPRLDASGVLGQVAQRRRVLLQAQAARIGAWIYAEPPRAFARRLGRYWASGGADTPPPSRR